ncbi:GroES-like protein [Imleria badia]|nr:GroES-like protein [Imleria badia]
MRAVVYEGPFAVSVKEIAKPVLSRRLTTTCMGRTAAPAGIIFGHENMGIVDEVGSASEKGDRVVMPFNVACGRCLNCEEGRSALTRIAWVFKQEIDHGFISESHKLTISITSDAGCLSQEYVKVSFADFNTLMLPPGTEHQEDFALLADLYLAIIYPRWHGVELSRAACLRLCRDFMAAYSAILGGASEMYVVGCVPERLQKAQEIGCVPIDFSKGGPVELTRALRGGQVLERNFRREVDRGVDGDHATTGDGKTEKPNAVLEALINVVRPTGDLGIPGLYVPSDPGAPDSAAAKYVEISTCAERKLFEKGLRIGTGHCNVKAYNHYLRDLIISGKAKPSFVVSHNLLLDDAATAYDRFDKRVDGFTKVLLHP